MIISILTWISIIAGGILVLLMLLSLIGGLELDLDIGGDADVDSDGAGGLGIIKTALTFFSIGSWVTKIFLVSNKALGISLLFGALGGIIAVFILSYFFKFLLKQQKFVTWNISDAVSKRGNVYLKVPAKDGSGIVQVEINGSVRELKAKSADSTVIKTGANVLVVDYDNDHVLVKEI